MYIIYQHNYLFTVMQAYIVKK